MTKWIAVSDRMPSYDESIFYWCFDEKYPELPPRILQAYHTPKGKVAFFYDGGGSDDGVTHWTPAIPPEPPKIR